MEPVPVTPTLAVMTAHSNNGHAIADVVVQGRLSTPARQVMRPGVVSLPEDASLRQVQRAMVSHNVHAVLVVAAATGQPLGWITSHGLLRWCERDTDLRLASDAIDEAVVIIEPSEPASQALSLLRRPCTTHLLVARAPGVVAEGVLADLDVIRLVA